jgi:hypothetical protein
VSDSEPPDPLYARGRNIRLISEEVFGCFGIQEKNKKENYALQNLSGGQVPNPKGCPH